MSKETKHLILEMSVGMACYELILAVAAWFLQDSMKFAIGPAWLGLLAGFFCDILMLVHMAYITEHVADSMDEGYASKKTIVHAILRKIVFVIVLLILGTRPQINAVAMLLGALALKAGAYLQPLVHRAFSKA